MVRGPRSLTDPAPWRYRSQPQALGLVARVLPGRFGARELGSLRKRRTGDVEELLGACVRRARGPGRGPAGSARVPRRGPRVGGRDAAVGGDLHLPRL